MPTVSLHDKSFDIFITEEKIQTSIKNIASNINNDYKDKNPLFIGILNGSFLFAADLFKQINGNCEITFLKLTSYEGVSSSGAVRELIGINENIKNRHVIILEDIVDTGVTLEKIIEILSVNEPASIKIATLLFKPKAYQKTLSVDYVGFEVGNEFLVGYGLDYDGLGRNLKDIYKIVG